MNCGEAQNAEGNAPHRSRSRVAIIGTGLAGLTTAHLLHNDKEQKHEVTLFDQANSLSFDGASVTVRNEKTGAVERIDLPMRASAGGYYANLMRMYDYLGIPLHPIRFLFAFAKALPASLQSASNSEVDEPDAIEATPGTYFIHASNLHQLPPPRPLARGLFLYVTEVLYLIVCHFWFSVACFLIPPITTARKGAPRRFSGQKSISDSEHSEHGETLGQYVERIWLPRRYVTHYLLPLMSSVSTCSHNEQLAFPASDVVNYKKLSQGEQHYVVCGGITQVQSKLAEGITDVRLGARVLQVSPGERGVSIRWQLVGDQSGSVQEEVFERVILGVSPDVVARIFSPLATALSQIPTRQVESSVVSPNAESHSIAPNRCLSKGCFGHENHTAPAQILKFRTSFSESGSLTEALHDLPSGVTVETCPLDADSKTREKLHTAKFTRTLRTTQSRAVVQEIMGLDEPSGEAKRDGDAHYSTWRNGQDGVWLVGAWCWDGMVLLEGCVVSAMRVAQDFGVSAPWKA